jgi:hypothetical protein
MGARTLKIGISPAKSISPFYDVEPETINARTKGQNHVVKNWQKNPAHTVSYPGRIPPSRATPIASTPLRHKRWCDIAHPIAGLPHFMPVLIRAAERGKQKYTYHCFKL